MYTEAVCSALEINIVIRLQRPPARRVAARGHALDVALFRWDHPQ